MPKISITIPAHNAAQWLSETLESVRIQTFDDWECIVVDDCSSDETWEIISAFGCQDERFVGHQILKSLQRPYPASKNIATALATGSWIASLDADDLWDENKLARICSVIDSTPQAVLLYHPMRILHGTEIRPAPELPSIPATMKALVRSNFIMHSSVVLRCDAIRAIGGYDANNRICHDWDLWIRVARAYGVRAMVAVPEVLGTYRMLQSSLSANHALMSRGERQILRKNLLRRGWMLLHPILTIHMVDGQVERDLWRARHKESNQRKSVVLSLLSCIIYPIAMRRWRRLLIACHNPGGE